MKNREKLTASVQQTLVAESTKEAVVEIANYYQRDIQEIVRFSLNAVAKRWREGKKLEEELY